MINPIPQLLFLTILTILSIPLTFLAIITTTLAATALAVLAISVYIDLGLALIGSLFRSSAPVSLRTRPLPQSKHSGATSPTLISYQRALRHRRTSSSSTNSGDSQTPTPKRASSGIFGLGAIGSTRDYEGVGGWRFTTPADDKHDEQIWMGLNSRLELPAAVPSGGMVNGEKKKKRHRRVLTEGNPPVRLEHIRPSTPEDLGMAPLVRGERTPEELTMEGGVGEGFFGGIKKPTGDDLRAMIGQMPSGSPTNTVSSGHFDSRSPFIAVKSFKS